MSSTAKYKGVFVPREVLRLPISAAKQLVLGRILSLQGDYRGCYAGNERLRRDLGLNSRSVSRHISDLVSDGWVGREDVAVTTLKTPRIKLERRLYPGPRLRVTDLSGVGVTGWSRGPRHTCPPGFDRLVPPSKEVSEDVSEDIGCSEEQPLGVVQPKQRNNEGKSEGARSRSHTSDLCATEGCKGARAPNATICRDCQKANREAA